jgi:hypothetical protein
MRYQKFPTQVPFRHTECLENTFTLVEIKFLVQEIGYQGRLVSVGLHESLSLGVRKHTKDGIRVFIVFLP